MYYFAYASNLSRKQMAERCPAAKPGMVAKLPHYKVVFVGWSRKWRGGYATIRQSTGGVVVGALYDISEQGLRMLDKHRGLPPDLRPPQREGGDRGRRLRGGRDLHQG